MPPSRATAPEKPIVRSVAAAIVEILPNSQYARIRTVVGQPPSPMAPG